MTTLWTTLNRERGLALTHAFTPAAAPAAAFRARVQWEFDDLPTGVWRIVGTAWQRSTGNICTSVDALVSSEGTFELRATRASDERESVRLADGGLYGRCVDVDVMVAVTGGLPLQVTIASVWSTDGSGGLLRSCGFTGLLLPMSDLLAEYPAADGTVTS